MLDSNADDYRSLHREVVEGKLYLLHSALGKTDIILFEESRLSTNNLNLGGVLCRVTPSNGNLVQVQVQRVSRRQVHDVYLLSQLPTTSRLSIGS